MEQLKNLSRTSLWSGTVSVTALKREYLEIELQEDLKEYISDYTDIYSIKTKILNTKDSLVDDNYNFTYETYIIT